MRPSPLRVCHLLPRGDRVAAGLLSAVHGLTAAQRGLGLQAEVMYADPRPFPLQAHRLLEQVLRSSAGDSLVLHSHGLWLAPSRVSRRLRRQGVPTVVSPHGMLDPWAWQRRRWLKQALWNLGEAETLSRAGCMQVLCGGEAQAVRSLGISTPLALIPNGVDLPSQATGGSAALPPWADQVPPGAPVLLFLGRFHPKKGLEPLLEAWRAFTAPSGLPSPWLVFAGYGDQGGLARRLAAGDPPRCLVLGEVQGERKAAAYANAAGFVLPSFSEGLPMAALEAMSWGVPCLLSQACNLPEAFAAGAALPADPEAGALTHTLQRFWGLTDGERRAMGQAGRALVAERFTWQGIAARTLGLYEWLLGRGGCPPFVQVSD